VSLAAWWRGLWAPAASTIPPAPADTLGAATLPSVVIAPKPAAPAPVIGWGVPPEAIALSKAFEGFCNLPYRCQAGVWTIGYGSTRDKAGHPVSPSTPRITEAEAAVLAARDLERAANLMAADFPKGLPPRWWAVGVLMCNNMGRMSVWGPSLLRFLPAGAWRVAAAQMRHYRNADGKPSLGLRRRRWAEAAFALGMAPDEAKRRAWAEINTPDDWPPLPP
jgi:lysozyme